MLRKRTTIHLLLPLAAVCVALVADIGSAPASPQFSSTFGVGYSPNEAGRSAAPDLHFTWSDPGEPGGLPRKVNKIEIVFPKGTRIDTSALPECTATDKQVRALGSKACPLSSRLGYATSDVTTGVTPTATTQITFFNAPQQIIVLVKVDGRALANYRDEIEGSTVTVNLGLPSGLALLRLDANINRHSRGRGKQRRVYFRNPRSCPSTGTWTSRVTFSYRDGSSDGHTVGSPCTRAK